MAVGTEGVLWVTDGNHVSRSTDEGVSFLPFNEGVPGASLSALALDGDSGLVYLGSQYDGAYTLFPRDASFVPFVPADGLQGGFAVVNPRPAEAVLGLTLYGGSGEPVGTGPTFPVGPEGQLARTLPEAAGGPVPDGAAWGELQGLTSVPGLVSVFDWSLDALDASALPSSTHQDVVFPDLTLPDISKFYLTNPNEQTAEAEMQLVSADGIPRTEAVRRSIGARQSATETLTSLFPGYGRRLRRLSEGACDSGHRGGPALRRPRPCRRHTSRLAGFPALRAGFARRSSRRATHRWTP